MLYRHRKIILFAIWIGLTLVGLNALDRGDTWLLFVFVVAGAIGITVFISMIWDDWLVLRGK